MKRRRETFTIHPENSVKKTLNKRLKYQRTFVGRDDVYHIILYYIIYRYTLEQLQMIYVRL
jgi:hypothetical protein